MWSVCLLLYCGLFVYLHRLTASGAHDKGWGQPCSPLSSMCCFFCRTPSLTTVVGSRAMSLTHILKFAVSAASNRKAFSVCLIFHARAVYNFASLLLRSSIDGERLWIRKNISFASVVISTFLCALRSTPVFFDIVFKIGDGTVDRSLPDDHNIKCTASRCPQTRVMRPRHVRHFLFKYTPPTRHPRVGCLCR